MERLLPDLYFPLPHSILDPLGRTVKIIFYVDSNHAVNILNRQSHSGILIYVNNTPVIWYYKKKNTVESSSFSSKFLALMIATELVEDLRYKLWGFGLPLGGPANILCYNKSGSKNVSVPT